MFDIVEMTSDQWLVCRKEVSKLYVDKYTIVQKLVELLSKDDYDFDCNISLKELIEDVSYRVERTLPCNNENNFERFVFYYFMYKNHWRAELEFSQIMKPILEENHRPHIIKILIQNKFNRMKDEYEQALRINGNKFK